MIEGFPVLYLRGDYRAIVTRTSARSSASSRPAGRRHGHDRRLPQRGFDPPARSPERHETVHAEAGQARSGLGWYRQRCLRRKSIVNNVTRKQIADFEGRRHHSRSDKHDCTQQCLVRLECQDCARLVSAADHIGRAAFRLTDRDARWRRSVQEVPRDAHPITLLRVVHRDASN